MRGRAIRRLRSRWRGWVTLVPLIAVAAGVVGWRSRARPDAEALLIRARSESRAGRHASAASILDRVARLREPTPVDRMVRAEVASAAGRDREALEELARVPDGDPAAPMARLRAGRIEVKRGRLLAAEGLFLAAAAGAPQAVEPHRELAYIDALQHRLGDFDRQFEAVSDLGGLDERSLVTWSRIHSSNWNAERDIDALAGAVRADPTDTRSRLALAEAHLRGNRPDEATRVLAPLPESDPDARVLRVSIALARGDRAGAESLLAGGPTDHPALARLRGNQALARREPVEAARQFRIALAAEPDDRAALFGLGTALKGLGESAEAEAFLEAARRRDRVGVLVERVVNPKGLDEPGMRARLGAACEAAGRLGEARAWYRSAIAHDPLDEGSQRALYRLDHRDDGRPRAEGRGPAAADPSIVAPGRWP